MLLWMLHQTSHLLSSKGDLTFRMNTQRTWLLKAFFKCYILYSIHYFYSTESLFFFFFCLKLERFLNVCLKDRGTAINYVYKNIDYEKGVRLPSMRYLWWGKKEPKASPAVCDVTICWTLNYMEKEIRRCYLYICQSHSFPQALLFFVYMQRLFFFQYSFH